MTRLTTIFYAVILTLHPVLVVLSLVDGPVVTAVVLGCVWLAWLAAAALHRLETKRRPMRAASPTRRPHRPPSEP